jgi:hypothetical protein
MKDVFKLIRARSTDLSRNVLFTRWLSDDSIAAADRLAFSPMALDFIMGFRDFNRYYVIYPEPRNELEEALNAHAREDETHSLLLLEDWSSMQMDERLGWAPRDLYWWMTSEETSRSRRLDFELMQMVWENPDPLVRFAIIESMEAAGSVFFRRTVPLADDLEKRTGRPFPYFGKYHLDRETGHLQNADEKAFFRAPMSDATRDHACGLVNRVFDIFEEHFRLWERYGRDVHEGNWRFRPSEDGRASATMRTDSPRDVSRCASLDHPSDLSGVARDLAVERKAAYDELWAMPGYRWIRESFPGDFRAMTRYFLLQWIVDNWSCADYFNFDTTYANPTSPIERGINRLSTLYASEMKRRYAEWETLNFDEFTGFSVADALRHYWLDEMVDGHRAVFADLRKLTFRHPAPLHRYWIMKCFVRFGDTMMHSLGVAMRRSLEPDESFITFAGHPERLHPDLPDDPEADAAIESLERQSLTEEDVATIREIIAATKAQEGRRAELTWKVVETRRYEAMHEQWLRRGRGERDGSGFHSVRHQSDRTGAISVEK